ncbi:MAG: sensor histidine kinase [Planctomycetota bacterium]
MWKTWIGFGLIVLLVTGGLAWLSVVLLRFERDSFEADARERMGANLRLAVWRIDSLMAPVIAQEAARPPDQYRSLYPPPGAETGKSDRVAPTDILIPSPILKLPSEWALLNFQIDADGTFHSPQVPPAHLTAKAVANGVTLREIDSRRNTLNLLQGTVDVEDLDRKLAGILSDRANGSTGDMNIFFNEPVAAPNPTPQSMVQSRAAMGNLNARQRALNRYAGQEFQQVADNTFPVPRPSKVKVSHLIPLWLPSKEDGSPSLILVRRVEKKGAVFHQGVLVDWPQLKGIAEEEVKDLFPDAALRPCERVASTDMDKALAVLPAVLDPGSPPSPEPPDWLTPVRVGLASLWIATLAGAAVVGAGLRSLLALNRRRLDFVSAVTHELRTPLTTFRMYAEMLKEGMVPEEKRSSYFATLHEESRRLSHLVQNVLDYSRLESDRLAAKREKAPLARHLERAVDVLRERCEQKGVPFQLCPDPPFETEVALDGTAVGQILYNLVDNACKYGEGEVTLEIERKGDRLLFIVSDRGAGIDGSEREGIFAPFQRGRESEGKGAGVGLGLALCRRWAVEMGGKLRLEGGKGSRFVLDLPVN